VIGRRVGKKSLGFRAMVEGEAKEGEILPIRAQRDTELLRQAEPQDLLKYGLIPEFVGRLPVLGILDELDEVALVEILTKPRNAILKQYAKLFDYESVKVTFSDDAAKEIAREALQRKVGARGLRMILEELMLDLMYYVPGNKKITELTITAEMVKKHSLTLPMLLEKAG
jgi:ATP-dependent Clp protease ATP-binding subunit ClpX